ncbi:MAG TPA: hypothetical protein DCG75_10325 [Bacteroidales bacterium]|nr:hypothetical protein [Bacteroidales bacterium]
MLYLKILLLLILVFILYQDLRYQAVSWIFFVVGLALTLIISIKENYLTDLIVNSTINFLFILFQLSVIYLFTWIKFKKKKNIFKSVFGLGDLLFLLMIIPLFSPLNFVIFFIASIIFTLFVYTILRSIKIYKKHRIPLAGLQSLFLFIVLISQIFSKFNLYNDYYILQFIIK